MPTFHAAYLLRGCGASTPHFLEMAAIFEARNCGDGRLVALGALMGRPDEEYGICIYYKYRATSVTTRAAVPSRNSPGHRPTLGLPLRHSSQMRRELVLQFFPLVRDLTLRPGPYLLELVLAHTSALYFFRMFFNSITSLFSIKKISLNIISPQPPRRPASVCSSRRPCRRRSCPSRGSA